MTPTGHARHRHWGAVVLALLLIPAAAGAWYFGYNVGTLTLRVTDDEIAQFASLNVTFDEVSVHSAGALTATPWVNVKVANATVDLTTLANGIDEIVAMAKVPAGKYTQLRLHVVLAEGMLKTGEHKLLTVPGGQLLTETPFEVRAQGSVTIVLRLLVVDLGARYQLQPALGSIEGSA